MVENGLVEIRYKPQDGRLYRARPSNLTISDPKLLPDETCGPATPAVRKESANGENAGRADADEGRMAAPGSKWRWEAWTDGACSGNPGPSGLGVVLIKGGERIDFQEYLGKATNNIAELTAILRALEQVPPEEPLLIHTDSQYSIGVLQRGWKAKANRELIASIRQELTQRPQVWLKYTPGHAGVALNERADKLARTAASTGKTAKYVMKRQRGCGG